MPVFTLARPALVRGSEANVRSVNAGYGPRTTSRLQIALFARVGGQGVFNGIPPLANLLSIRDILYHCRVNRESFRFFKNPSRSLCIYLKRQFIVVPFHPRPGKGFSLFRSRR